MFELSEWMIDGWMQREKKQLTHQQGRVLVAFYFSHHQRFLSSSDQQLKADLETARQKLPFKKENIYCKENPQ